MKLRGLTIIAATAAWMPAAHAQFGDNDSGLYLGAALGNYSAEIDGFGDANFDFDENDSASRFFAGWRFSNFFAVEVARYDFDQATNASALLNVSAETRGWAPAVVGTLPVGPIELFVRGGMIFYDVEFSLNGGEVFDESGQDPVYSAGIGFTAFERLNLKLEYERVEISEFDDAEAVWISGAWRF